MPLVALLPEPLASLFYPWEFMGLALSFLPGTVLALLRAGDFATLFSRQRLRAAWFGRFWAVAGPLVRANAEKKVIPLLQGRVTRGVVPPPTPTPPAPAATTGSGPLGPSGPSGSPSPSTGIAGSAQPDQQGQPQGLPHGQPGLGRQHHPAASGTVLEIGPGSGMWTSLFTPAHLPGVRKIYGVEPNAAVHPLLREQIAAAGLDDGTYEILPLGVEDLAASGRVPRDSVDCVVTVLCLCSIPDPQRTMAELYGYLRPGGRWYVYEHVRCFRSQGTAMGWYQAFLNLLWPHLIGGCEMRRDTDKWLREAGPWRDVDLCPLGADEPWYFTMPHIIGVLTK